MNQSSHQRRRDKRYPARLPIRTRVAGSLQDLFSEDVSFRGLFLGTDRPPPLRQLIRIETILPPHNVPFATHGMVVHVAARGDGPHHPGFGVQFYGMGDERRAWEAFIKHIERTAGALPDRRESMPPPAPSRGGGRLAMGSVAKGYGGDNNRRYERFPVVLEVRPRDLEDLFRLYSRDVSVGGMFLSTAREVPAGSEIRLDVRHPHNGSVFHLTAVVRRESRQPSGIGVEFTGLDDQRRRAFFEFIHAPIPQDLDDDFDVAEGDDLRRRR